MRNFEERMEEIQKRSKARILRRRRQLTALCVPLVTGLFVGAALMIQPEIYQPVDITQQSVTLYQEYSDHLSTLPIEYSIPKYTDNETVTSIKKLIAELAIVEEFTVDATCTDTIRTQATSVNEVYMFVLESEDGTTEYTLIGNTLADRNADVVYKLTDHQRVTLLKLLELPAE